MSSLLFHPRKPKAKPPAPSTPSSANPMLPGSNASNSRVRVRTVQAPVPVKRKAEDALGVNGAPAMKKARSSSAESCTPPPVRSTATKKQTPLRDVKPSVKSLEVEVKRERSATPVSALASSRSRSPTPLVKKEKGKGKGKEGRAEGQEEGRSCLSDVVFHAASMRSYADAYGGDLSKFRTWFENPADPSDTTFVVTDTTFPSAYLELPARNARAHYILAVRKDPDAYAPLYDLEETLAVIVETYLPEDLKEIFGPHPDDLNDLSAYGLQKDLRRARVKKNGPSFLSILSTINGHIQRLKYPPLPAELDSYADGPENGMLYRVKEWTDVPNKVAERIFEETYQRVVPPHYARLREYASFSSETYGEMLPPFVNRIIKETNLGPNDVLVDLGAGVGNVLIQAALQTGCETYGVEIQKGAAEVGMEQLAQARARAAAWGVKLGALNFEEGDMLTSPGVDEALRRASVVVCNNKMFSENLNTELKSKFLDLPEGARIVSLHPFAPPDARNNARSREAIETILTVQTRSYGSRDVSWSGGGGEYYVHTVDRAGLAKMRAMESGSGRSSRASRR